MTLEDPCKAATVASQVTKPVIETYTYYITDDTTADTEMLTPKFTVDPSWCQSSLTFEAPDLDTFVNWSLNDQQISYNEITDSLTMAGVIDKDTNPDLEKTYQVTLTYTVTDFNGDTFVEEVNYSVVIKNPCIH